jgi:hypothetical protein
MKLKRIDAAVRETANAGSGARAFTPSEVKG